MRKTTTLILLLAAAAAGAPNDKARLAGARKAIRYIDARLFTLPPVQGTPREPFTYAVAGLVHLMDGPRTGRPSPIPPINDYLLDYLEEVEDRSRDPDELPRTTGSFNSWSLIQYTWPLAVTGMYFGEQYLRGKSKRQSLDAVRRIVKLLKEAQQPNGGWGHGRWSGKQGPDPRNPFADRMPQMRGTYPTTLVASTNTVAITLGLLSRIAKDETAPLLDSARKYYRKAQLADGSFPYDPGQNAAGLTAVGRTAGAVYAMHCLGMPRDRRFDRSVAYMLSNLPYVPEGHGSPCLNLMHGALACHALGPKVYRRFRRQFEAGILAHQGEDGALHCICEQRAPGVTCDTPKLRPAMLLAGQKVYTTALHAFVLLLDSKRLKLLDQPPRPRATTR